MRCTAYCLATEFNVLSLTQYLRAHYPVVRFREVAHVPVYADSQDEEDGQVFFFPFGVVVFWGFILQQEQQWIQDILPYCEGPYDIIEDDNFFYQYGETAKVEDDEIILPNQDVLTKLAFSHGLAQSVKLAIFEQTIQKTIHLSKELPELLAKKGRINLSRNETRRMMGRLFIDRSSINLHQELLDTPEFFWEYSDLEPYYLLTVHYLDRERRVYVLNQKLKVIQELFDMLATELNHQHSSRLEWTIIGLIVIEVLLHVFTDILGYF